jgi:hypothetical protein
VFPNAFSLPLSSLKVSNGLSLTDGALNSWLPSPISHIPQLDINDVTINKDSVPKDSVPPTYFEGDSQSDYSMAKLTPIQKSKLGMAGILGIVAGVVLARALSRFLRSQNRPANSQREPTVQGADISKVGSKDLKRKFFEPVKSPIAVLDVIKKFRKVYGEDPNVYGDFERGLIVYSDTRPLHLIVVPSNHFIASAYYFASDGRINRVELQGKTGKKHMYSSIVTYPNDQTRRDIDFVARKLMSEKTDLSQNPDIFGALFVGFERELWAINPERGELEDITDEELLVGEVEIDEGFYITPAQAALGMAVKQQELERNYPHSYLNNTSVPVSGSPQNVDLNIYDLPEKGDDNIGPYVAVIERNCYRRYRPHTPESIQIREQQAAFHGYESANQMIAEHGDCRTWSTAACHLNVGLINSKTDKEDKYQVDFDLARNTSNLVLSEFGSIVRMFTASSTFITGFVPRIDGQVPLDIREFIRQDMGTAKSHNQPIRDDHHYQEIVRQTIVAGQEGADRLSRAIVAHTNEDGSYAPAAHGAGRWRLEDIGKPSGRIEYTGAGSTTILPKLRSMAILQIFQALSILATHENKDVFDYIQENYGFTKDEIWGDADRTVQEFMLYGNKSERTQTLVERLTSLIERVHIPSLEEAKEIALAGLRNFRKETTFKELAHGKGTLGGALMPLALNGVDSLTVARIVDAFQRKEAAFILSLGSEEEVNRYLKGEIGFEFDILEYLS